MKLKAGSRVPSIDHPQADGRSLESHTSEYRFYFYPNEDLRFPGLRNFWLPSGDGSGYSCLLVVLEKSCRLKAPYADSPEPTQTFYCGHHISKYTSASPKAPHIQHGMIATYTFRDDGKGKP